MFRNIFKQELIYWLKNPLTWFFAVVFFSFTFLLFAGSAGLFDPHSDGEGLREHLNSHYSINFILQYMTKLMVVLLPAVVGASIYKDFKYRVHSVLFSYPMDKVTYLLARISASFAIVLLIASGVVIAMMTAEFMPGLDPAKMGTFKLAAYLHTFTFYTIPNLLFTASIVVAIILFFRNIYSAFAAVLIPFLLQSIFENAFAGNGEMVSLMDPFGQNSLMYYTKDWSLLDKNESTLPIGRLVLLNRILWLIVSSILLATSIHFFKLHESLSFKPLIRFRKSKYVSQSKAVNSDFELNMIHLSASTTHYLKTLWHLSVRGFFYIIKSPAFLIISVLAVLSMIFAVNRVTQSGEMILLPLTRVILMVPSAFYSIICMLLIFIYTGLLVNRERNARIEQLIDTTSTPFWVLWSSKLLTMLKVEVLLMILFLITGIIIQTLQGYYQYEIGLYIYHLFVFTLIPLIIWTVAAFFIHTLLDNLYLGLFVLLFGWVGVEGLPQIGLNSYLVRFNRFPALVYSDINGYGHSSKSFFILEGYWLSFVALLIVISHLIWRYGVAVSLMARIKAARSRLSKRVYLLTSIFLLSMLFFGMQIADGESEQLNLSSRSLKKHLSEFEKGFKSYANKWSPKIRTLTAEVELYPDQQSFVAKGSYSIENPWIHPIDTFLIRTGFDETSSFNLSVPYEIIDQDEFMKVYVIKLVQPLKMGEFLTMDFTIESISNTLFDRNTSILNNGTLIKHDIFPRLGYSFSNKLPFPTESIARLHHYQAVDSDLIDVSLTIGTSKNQMAIAPGELQQEWEEAGRRYLSYATNDPIKFSFGINSGKFQHSKLTAQSKSVEIYSHHTHNIETIASSIDRTLSYQHKYFNDYSYPDVRVIEFPDSEGSYSTAFANNIPMSEIRFVSNPDTAEKKTNLSFYVPAHELIHHWWGSTLIPARAKGASMLTESITEYLTLQVYESHYGKEQADDFLKLQHRRYWSGHNKETGTEPPLYLVESPQQYISYGKGTVVFNGLSELIGKERFNAMLSSFLEQYQANKPPYPVSIDFIDFLKAHTGDSLHSFIGNQLTTVSWIEGEIAKAEAIKIADDEYKVTIELDMKKLEIDNEDSSKEPKEAKIDEWIQIGFYDASNELISLDWINVNSSLDTMNFLLKRKPSKVILDPDYLSIMKKRKDGIEIQ